MSFAVSYFEELYLRSPDPWGVGSRPYEQRKLTLTLAALPRARYSRAFEPGCSIGALTSLLATRVERLVAWDVSPAALELARQRGLPAHVELGQGCIPHDWPEGRFDLIVFSELGYYLDGEDLDLLVSRACASLERGGHLVAVHWRGEVPGAELSADRVHARLAASQLRGLARYEESLFVLDVFGAGRASRLAHPDGAACR